MRGYFWEMRSLVLTLTCYSCQCGKETLFYSWPAFLNSSSDLLVIETSKTVPTESIFSKQRHFHLIHYCTYHYMIYHPTHQSILKQVLQKAKSTFYFLSEEKPTYKRRENPTDVIKVNKVIHKFMRQMFSLRFYYRC